MKLLSALAALFLTPVGALGQTVPPQIPFTASDALKLPPGMHLGEVAGVAVNRQRHLFVFQR